MFNRRTFRSAELLLILQAFVHAFKGYVNNTQSLKVEEYPTASDSPKGEILGYNIMIYNILSHNILSYNIRCMGLISSTLQFQPTSGCLVVTERVIETPFMTITPIVLSQTSESGSKRGLVEEAPVEDTSAKKQRVGSPSASGDDMDVAWVQSSSLPSLDHLSSTWSPPSDSVCYVCEMKDAPGKFDPTKAEALDVPFGKVWVPANPASRPPPHPLPLDLI